MLTEKECRSFEAQEKSYKKFDGGGVFLLMRPNGRKYSHLKYSYAGEEKLIALWVYPEISLKEAMAKREKHKQK